MLSPADPATCKRLGELLLDAGDVTDALDDNGVEVKEALQLYRDLENLMVQSGCPLPKAEEDD